MFRCRTILRVATDICISGGGTVGLALGCAIGQSDLASQLKTAIIERNPKPTNDALEGVQLRTVALTPRSIQFLDRIGVWEDVQQLPVSHWINKIVISDVPGSSLLEFDDPNGMFHVVSTDQLTEVLRRHIPACVDIYYNHSLSGRPEETVGGVKLTCNVSDSTQPHSAPEITTSLLVAADGANSPLRPYTNVPIVSRTYGQHAIVATISLDVDEDCANSISYQHFFGNGDVIAFLPMSSTTANIVYSMDAERALELKQSKDDLLIDINEKLSQGGRGKVPRATEVLAHGAFPLQMLFATQAAARRVALVGDAHHTLHPMAGQGLNFGLYDSINLTNVIHDACEVGADLGGPFTLQQYSEKSFPSTASMIAGVEAIKAAFLMNCGPFPFLRGSALSVLNLASPIKKMVTGFAAGTHLEEGVV